MYQFSFIILSFITILSYQNCSQKTADIVLQSEKTDGDLISNTFFIEKGNALTNIKPFIGSEQELQNKIFDLLEKQKTQPSNTFTSLSFNGGGTHLDRYYFSPENKTPIKLQHGVITKINADNFDFEPNQNEIGDNQTTLKVIYEQEVSPSTVGATIKDNGKYFKIYNMNVNYRIIIHSRKTPTELLDLKKSLTTDTSLTPLEVDKIPPLKFDIITDGDFAENGNISPEFLWKPSLDLNTGIMNYEVCLGSQLGLCDILDWQDIGFKTKYTFNHLFKLKNKYYNSVRSVDFAGNKSEAIKGDGWVYQPQFSPFSFEDKFNLKPNSAVESNTIKLEGRDGTPTEAICDNCTASNDGGKTFSDHLENVKAGDSLMIRTITSLSDGDSSISRIKVGNTTSSPWTVSTLPPFEPTPFSLKNVVDVDANIEVTSEPIQISGKQGISQFIDCDNCLAIYVSNDNGKTYKTIDKKILATQQDPDLRVNSGSFIKIKMLSSKNPGSSVQSILKMGKFTNKTPWVVTTKEGFKIQEFKLIAQSNLAVNTSVTSNEVILGGTANSLPVPVTCDNNCLITVTFKNGTMKFNAVSGDVLVNLGDKIKFSVKTPAAPETEIAVNIKIGNVQLSQPWYVKTEPFKFITAIGGTVETLGNYKIHTYITDANFLVQSLGNSNIEADKNFQVFLVGGGGGGGPSADFKAGGGGGGGQVVYKNKFSFIVGTFNLKVGLAGASGKAGTNSSISSLTAIGGSAGVPLGGTNYAKGGNGAVETKTPSLTIVNAQKGEDGTLVTIENTSISNQRFAAGGGGGYMRMYANQLDPYGVAALNADGGLGGGGKGGISIGENATGYGSGGGGGGGTDNRVSGVISQPGGKGSSGVVIIVYRYK